MGPPLRRITDDSQERRAGEGTRPYGVSRTGNVCSAKPGAKAEPHQRQFLQTQGPVARRELRKATQILRAGRTLPTQRDNPRKRGPGKAVLWAQSAHRPRPRWRFGYFAAMGKVTRRPQAAKLPAKWRAGSSRPTPGKRLFLHRPLIRPLRGHLPLSLLSLRDISP